MLGYSLQVLAGIATTVAFANLIPRETFGTYQFIISTAAILGVFTLTGMGTAINRAVARGALGSYRYGVRIKLLASIGIVFASGIFAGYYFYQDNAMLGSAFLIAGATTPLISTFTLYEQFLNGTKRFKDAAIIGTLRRLVPLTAILTALFYTNDVIILIATYFLSTALSYLLAYAVVHFRFRPPYEKDPATLRYSLHLSAMHGMSKALSHLDKVLIWYFIGPLEVALFTIAQLATLYSGSLINTLSQIAMPKLAVRDLPTLQQTLPRKVALFTGAMAIATILYILLAPYVFALLFPEYPESVPLTQALALTLLFVPRSLYSKALTTHACTRELYLLSIIQPIIRITALASLLPLFGLWGVVYALVLSGLIETIVVYTLFKKAVAPTHDTTPDPALPPHTTH